jgi:hypothetical protein
MPKEKREVMLELDGLEGQAFHVSLSAMEPEGRSDLRHHAHLMEALREEDGPIERADEKSPFNVQAKDEGGVVTMYEDDLKFFDKKVGDALKQRKLPGGISMGLNTLLNKIDDALKALDKKEEAESNEEA